MMLQNREKNQVFCLPALLRGGENKKQKKKKQAGCLFLWYKILVNFLLV